MKYEYQLNILVEDLEKVLDSKAINYEEAKKVNAQCVYSRSIDPLVLAS